MSVNPHRAAVRYIWIRNYVAGLIYDRLCLQQRNLVNRGRRLTASSCEDDEKWRLKEVKQLCTHIQDWVWVGLVPTPVQAMAMWILVLYKKLTALFTVSVCSPAFG